jgi:hypothetical protein
MLTYQYTGSPLDISNFSFAFGAPPLNITATVQVADAFPEDANFVGGWFGGISAGNLTGIISASISDGVRTVTPDFVFLAGYGTTIRQWLIGGGALEDPTYTNARQIFSAKLDGRGQIFVGDIAVFERTIAPAELKVVAKTRVLGQWTQS